MSDRLATSAEKTPDVLIEQFLEQPTDEQFQILLDDMRGRATEFIPFFDEHEKLATRFEQALDRLGDGRIGDVYVALASDDNDEVPCEHLDADDARISEALREARLTSDQWIGRAFTEGLMESLPGDLGDLGKHLSDIPLVSPEVAEILRGSPSSKAAESPELIETLANRGLTPVSIFQATEALPALLRRLRRRGKLDSGTDVFFLDEDGNLTAGSAGFPSSLVLESVRHATECDSSTAATLLRWLVAVAQARPRLFGDLWSEPYGTCAVRLNRLDVKVDVIDSTLIDRWATQHPIVTENEDMLGRFFMQQPIVPIFDSTPRLRAAHSSHG